MTTAAPPPSPLPIHRSRGAQRPGGGYGHGAPTALVLALVLSVGMIVLGSLQQRTHQRGEALFHGLAPLRTELATPVPRCAGCHNAAVGLGAVSLGLGDGLLPEPQPSPARAASVYTKQSFCRALRDGVDPTGTALTPAQPHQAIGAADCAALWAYLSDR